MTSVERKPYAKPTLAKREKLARSDRCRLAQQRRSDLIQSI